jgi:hypothetical protein
VTVYEIGDPPEEIVEAIREVTTEVDANDREMPTLVILEWLLSASDAKTNERLLRWAWDRYVEQPKRDALKMQTATRQAAAI